MTHFCLSSDFFNLAPQTILERVNSNLNLDAKRSMRAMNTKDRQSEPANPASSPAKKFHIGVAGLSCECCTFSPLLSGARDFMVSAAAELLANYGFFADYPDVDFTPLRRA